MAHIDAKELLAQANGRWHEIYAYLCPEWGDAVTKFNPGSRKTPPKTTCPVHGGKSGEAFSLLKDGAETGGVVCNSCGVQSSGYSALMWAKGWDFPTTLNEVAGALGIADSGQQPPVAFNQAKETKDDPKVVEKLRAKMNKLWTESYPLTADEAEPARRYFANRSLVNLGDLGGEVVFHPAVPYWEKQVIGGQEQMVDRGAWPCILSTVRDAEGRPVNLHRTYITDDGHKAPFDKVKKMMEQIPGRPISGGSIRLMPHCVVMGVAEGLETTLAVLSATLMPVQCLVNTTLMRSWEPEPDVKYVFIFEDKDRLITKPNGQKVRAGTEAAKDLEIRLRQRGITVWRMSPPLELGDKKSVDWADVLHEKGVHGFPTEVRKWENLLPL